MTEPTTNEHEPHVEVRRIARRATDHAMGSLRYLLSTRSAFRDDLERVRENGTALRDELDNTILRWLGYDEIQSPGNGGRIRNALGSAKRRYVRNG